jgi:transposase-like protein
VFNAAVTKVLRATCQVCRVHFARNALAHTGKAQFHIGSVSTGTACGEPYDSIVPARWRTVADQLRRKMPKLPTLMDAAEVDVLATCASPPPTARSCPAPHLSRECLNGGMKRRGEARQRPAAGAV